MYLDTTHPGIPPRAPDALTQRTIHPFPKEGYVRLRNILAPIGPVPVSKSTLWDWVKAGKFPTPVKLSTKITAWKATDVHAFLADPQNWELSDAR